MYFLTVQETESPRLIPCWASFRWTFSFWFLDHLFGLTWSFLWAWTGRIKRKLWSVSSLSYKDAAAAAKSLQSCPTLCNPIRWQPMRLPCPWDSPGKNTALGCYALQQRIFLIQGLNLGLQHARVIIYISATRDAFSTWVTREFLPSDADACVDC